MTTLVAREPAAHAEPFVPAMPPRPPSGLGPVRLALGYARHNLLSAWSEDAFGARQFHFRLLFQRYYLCNAPDLVRRVFVDRQDNYDRKSPQMRRALAPLVGDGLFVSDGDLWRERRAWCAPAFRNSLLGAFAPVMVETATEVADAWAGVPDGQPVDMLNEMARLTARIIGRTVFGDDVSDEEAGRVVAGFSDYQAVVDPMDLSTSLNVPLISAPTRLRRRKRLAASSAQVHEVVDRIVARYRAGEGPARTTLLSLLLDEEASGGACPHAPQAARNEAVVMFMAGHETTANTLAWAWYLLANSPGDAARLHEELDAALGGRAPTLEDIPNLPFTRAVLEETLRLYPPVPLLSRQAREDDKIEGRPIRAGTIVVVLPYLLHRHPEHWESPDLFLPERFMPDRPRPDNFLYMPFSAGPRLCLGMRFGLTESILCLAALAQRFEARVAPGHEVEVECRLTLRPRGGLPMLLRARS